MIVARRVDVEGRILGFERAPPHPVNLKFFRVASSWTLVVLGPAGAAHAIARWLQTYSPQSIHIAPGLAPKVLRATFDELPQKWGAVFESVTCHYLELSPTGAASLFLEDTPAHLETFLETLGASDPPARSRGTVGVTMPKVKLTGRQLEVISLAVALGYYEIPHKLNLRTLATKLGLSVGAVSELLRRGESLIVTNYVDALSAARWTDVKAEASSGK